MKNIENMKKNKFNGLFTFPTLAIWAWIPWFCNDVTALWAAAGNSKSTKP